MVRMGYDNVVAAKSRGDQSGLHFSAAVWGEPRRTIGIGLQWRAQNIVVHPVWNPSLGYGGGESKEEVVVIVAHQGTV